MRTQKLRLSEVKSITLRGIVKQETSDEAWVVFDGTDYFVESADYDLNWDERVVFTGTWEECNREAEKRTDDEI